MKKLTVLTALCISLSVALARQATAQVTPVPGDPLTGSGAVTRTVLTAAELLATTTYATPVNDTQGFALPANAAPALNVFNGTLTLNGTATNGNFTLLTDIFSLIPRGNSPWKHLPTFSFQFVQNGSYLIPVTQGLFYTGSTTWNYIVGPGRVWQENSDGGYTRAAFPFSLVQYNQNCVHNGEMTFLFSNTKTPNISQVYYQITQETCYPMKFNMWGQITATYSPNTVSATTTAQLQNQEATEIKNRLTTKPFSALATDFPNSGIVLANFTAAYTLPNDITTYGLVLPNGTHYAAGNNCQTRFGNYAFCAEMRLPSDSVAKSVFAGVALMWLGQQYGAGVYNQLIKTFITLPSTANAEWNNTTFAAASDMATGSYNNPGYEVDENSTAMAIFIDDETYSSKVEQAFAFNLNSAAPDTLWIYHSSDTFLLTQAMNFYLQQQEENESADIFKTMVASVYVPLNLSQGGLTMIRTNDSATGAPTGYYGMFFIMDDIAKLASFLDTGSGMIGGKQVLDQQRLQNTLYCSNCAAGLPAAVPNSVPGTYFYKNDFWHKNWTPTEFPQYTCTFHVAFMSGYGGITVLLLPDGVIYYIFSDGNEFYWYGAVNEINKIAPLC